jgi:hypothetical protein
VSVDPSSPDGTDLSDEPDLSAETRSSAETDLSAETHSSAETHLSAETPSSADIADVADDVASPTATSAVRTGATQAIARVATTGGQVRRWDADDRGTFQVFEAVMVAVLIFTAILFFTTTARPTDPSEPGGIDLSQNAADMLDILKARTFAGAPFADVGATDGWVTNLVQEAGKSDASSPTRREIEDILSEVVPSGALYVLRLSNGVDELELAPGDGRTPHGARGAETYVFPTAAYDAADNVAITATFMEPPAGTGVAQPVYGLQLVVWFGA